MEENYNGIIEDPKSLEEKLNNYEIQYTNNKESL